MALSRFGFMAESQIVNYLKDMDSLVYLPRNTHLPNRTMPAMVHRKYIQIWNGDHQKLPNVFSMPATAGLYKNTKNTKHELVTFRNCPGLCPAILPKIIWSCQTANRGSKKCNMQYDGCLPLCKKIAYDSKQKENGQYVQKSSGNCLFTVGISLYSPSWDIVLPTYTLNLVFQTCLKSKLVLICWKTWNL